MKISEKIKEVRRGGRGRVVRRTEEEAIREVWLEPIMWVESERGSERERKGQTERQALVKMRMVLEEINLGEILRRP